MKRSTPTAPSGVTVDRNRSGRAASSVNLSPWERAAVRNCTVDGAVVVYGGADVEVAWNEVRRGNIASLGGERVRFTGNRQSGLRWGAGVDIADGQGHRVIFRQLVGVLARRIVCRVEAGDTLQTGERFGLMKFGSRMDVFVPAECELQVKPGDVVRGGESVLARWPRA